VILARIVACLVLVIVVHAPFASEPRLYRERAAARFRATAASGATEAAENSFAAIDLAVRARWSTVEVDIRKTLDDSSV
jgi:hypothetical protein